MVPIEIHWIRGRSGLGGNERVDRVAKRYAKLSAGCTVKPQLEAFTVFAAGSRLPARRGRPRGAP